MKVSGIAAVVGVTLMLWAGGAGATELVGAAELDHAVITKLSTLHGINSKVIARIDLTTAFATKSRWVLVVGKQPDEESRARNGVGQPQGAVTVCFVEGAEPDCSEAILLAAYRQRNIEVGTRDRRFYSLLEAGVVYSKPGNTAPLLLVKTCTMPGANGSCGVSTFLFDYDRDADEFRVVFVNVTGRNNNQETRFIEAGPLLGAVIVADSYGGGPPPTRANPYGYWIEVFKRDTTGSYTQVLAYRGKTSYADGNPLAVIDSEMPQTLRRLGLWKPGDALPVPLRMPEKCTRLVMRKGVQWCETAEGVEPTPQARPGLR